MLKTDESKWRGLSETSEFCLGLVDGCGAGQKLELVVCEKPPREVRVELRTVAWNDKIGWYCQQTLVLPSDLSAVEGLIGRAHRLMSQRSSHHPASAKVLAFPAKHRSVQRD